MIGTVYQAERFASKAHAGQVRKWSGEPYIYHPARVVDTLHAFGYGFDLVLATAWLHDVVEDTDVTLAEVNDKFGQVVALMLAELTKPAEPWTQAAAVIKLCDIYDNIRDIALVAPPVEASKYIDEKTEQFERLRRIAPDDVRLIEAVRRRLAAARSLAYGKWLLECPAA